MNTASFIGNITRDPEVRKTQTGLSVCGFTVAVNRQKPAADGTRLTDFIPCTAWEKTAELIGLYVHKGDRVAVTGAMQSRRTTYQGVDITVIECNIQHIDFLTTSRDRQERNERRYSGDNPYMPPQKPQEFAQRTNYVRDEEDIVSDEMLPF